MPSAAQRARDGLSGRSASSCAADHADGGQAEEAARGGRGAQMVGVGAAEGDAPCGRPPRARFGASLRHLLPMSSGWMRSSRLSSSRTPCRAKRSSVDLLQRRGEPRPQPGRVAAPEGVGDVGPPCRPAVRPAPGGGQCGCAGSRLSPPAPRGVRSTSDGPGPALRIERHREPPRVDLAGLPLQVADDRALRPAVVPADAAAACSIASSCASGQGSLPSPRFSHSKP